MPYFEYIVTFTKVGMPEASSMKNVAKLPGILPVYKYSSSSLARKCLQTDATMAMPIVFKMS